MDYVNDLISRYPILEPCKANIRNAILIISDSIKSGGKILVCGNGGSASDSDHMVGELMKSFVRIRPIDDEVKERLMEYQNGEELENNLQGAIPCINLTQHTALSTAFNNDVNPQLSFAQQTYGYGNKNDVFIGISTSGNSQNILQAAKVAKAKNLKVIGLTGMNKNKLSLLSDEIIQVPETETYKIQELHLPIYHCMCLALEKEFWP
jgi:D-sedoheptulose 7-phosphate isomerase